MDEMEIRYLPGGDSLLTVTVRDQAELHGLLARIRDMNMELVDVRRV